MDEMMGRIYEIFKDRFDREPVLIQSPGRINLIGEHTDYNDGFVLPAAIDKGIILAMAPNVSGFARFYSVDMDELFEQELGHELVKSGTRWANYLLGSLDQLRKQGDDIPGFDCVFGGNIPIGAGLSSSAALAAGSVFGLVELFGLSLSRLEMARLAQKVENDFVGVQCGIMDQFANLHGEEASVLKLDCRSLEYDVYPFQDNGVGIVLCDTGIQRELAGSEYNLRRKQCERGVELLRGEHPSIVSLRDADLPMLEAVSEKLPPVVYKRCRYVLEENNRVHAACMDLKENNFASFGRRMFESHEGLRTMYEVSCPELDALVDIARQSNGVLGARMMGGGFGGCTINLVEKDQISAFMEEIRNTYRKKIGSDIDMYEVQLGEGTRRVFFY